MQCRKDDLEAARDILAISVGVPPEERVRFLIVDRDESVWRGLAGCRLADDPSIIVLDRSGSVLARESGLFDEKRSLDAAIRIRAPAGRKS